MKVILLLLSITFGFASVTNAQDFNLFAPDTSAELDSIDDISELLSDTEKVIAYGKYNNKISANVSDTSVITLTLFDKPESFNVNNVVRKSDNRVSYAASDSKLNTMSVSEHDGEIVGSIWRNGILYKLRTTASGTTVLIEVAKEKLIDHGEDYQEEASTYELLPDSNNADSADEYTVIVVYTSAFAALAGNVEAYMDLLELETNTSYANSNVDTSVKIVHSYQTTYTDTNNFSTDLAYFTNPSNPETAQLHALRDEHSADIMIMLTGNGYGFCGLANGIGVSAEDAFGLASETCATGYYSFAHEVGHLFGARHIIANDPTLTPFAYGHGYCNVTPSTWRTVMAYGCPSGTGGPRIQQWSNPDVTISTEPTGTEASENNARVHNERAFTMANFRTEDDNFLLELIPSIISSQ